MTNTLGISQPRSVDLLPPTLPTIPEAIGKNIAIARARTRARIMAVVKADGYGHGACTVAQAAVVAADQIDIAIGSVDELEALLRRASSSVRVHLNLDTGMAREGCPMSEWDALIARARQGQWRGKIRVVGLMGHLPLADQAQPEANGVAVVQMR